MSFSEAIKFLEKEIQYTLTSDEAKEGISAFLEKRDPNWD
jgi:enoyl-CoA hydratase/carnithine racemase